MKAIVQVLAQHRSLLLKASLVSLGVIVGFTVLYLSTGYRYRTVGSDEILTGKIGYPAAETASKSARSGGRAGKVESPGLFIVIDRTANRLWLRDGDKTLLEAVISAGAGSVLANPSKSKEDWVFDTPIGRFKVVGKRRNPVWTAPDWEFVETNQPIPKNYGERVQEGMLGEYALDLNVPGYMIHGTLYTRLLGRNVSHGCIRVGRDDLRVLWKAVPIGTPVYIF